jgi:gliding motility-associated-like protein
LKQILQKLFNFTKITITQGKCILPFLLYVGFLFLPEHEIYCQTVVNNGANIVINSGAYFIISGDYINQNSNGDGQVNIDGKILIDGNWINNASNNVFNNIETTPDGLVLMRGTTPQYLGGSTPTHFENLWVSRSEKTLQVSNCEVNGIFTLDAIFDLNSKRLIVDNPLPAGISYKSKYILSETSPLDGYGEIQWNIGSTLGTYKIPFGSGFSVNNDLDLTLTTNTTGLPSSGNIVFATYPTDCSNEAFPLGVATKADEPASVADRYWIINADYNVSKPNTDIIFKYTFEDVDVCNENIVQENLKARRFNTIQNKWNDIEALGIANKNDRTVKVSNLNNSDLFEPWCLLVEPKPPVDIFIPNAFSPDGDGLNDYFGPSGIDLDKYTFNMYIFDRWGEMIYETDSALKLWNGKPSGSNTIAPIAVYTWLVILFDNSGQEYKLTGRVTLVR